MNKRVLMPCPFTGPKMFCAGPNILSQPKNLTASSTICKVVKTGNTVNLNLKFLLKTSNC